MDDPQRIAVQAQGRLDHPRGRPGQPHPGHRSAVHQRRDGAPRARRSRGPSASLLASNRPTSHHANCRVEHGAARRLTRQDVRVQRHERYWQATTDAFDVLLVSMFVDSHCHLNFPELAGQMPVLLEAMAREPGDARAVHQRHASRIPRRPEARHRARESLCDGRRASGLPRACPNRRSPSWSDSRRGRRWWRSARRDSITTASPAISNGSARASAPTSGRRAAAAGRS